MDKKTSCFGNELTKIDMERLEKARQKRIRKSESLKRILKIEAEKQAEEEEEAKEEETP